MMIFSITAIDDHKKIRQFTYGLNDLGDSLDFIHELVARGDSLVSVQVRDRQRVTDLPIETFNTVLASTNLDQLETEWKAILKYPSRSPKKQKMSPWVLEWVGYIEGEIIKKELTIIELDMALQVAVDLNEAKLLRPQNNTIIDRYNSILKRHNWQLTRLYTIRYRLLNGQDAAAVLE